MPVIPEFTTAEIAAIREMLVQRYRKEVEIHLADSELLLDHQGDPVSCPTVYWHERGANFVVFKMAPFCFRTQFFYTPHEQFGTGIDEYNDLDECVAAALQTQSDHERQRGADDAATPAPNPKPESEPEPT